MKPVFRTLIAATILAASSAAFAQTAPDTSAANGATLTKNYDVFVDKPTGFTFVKLPVAGKSGIRQACSAW